MKGLLIRLEAENRIWQGNVEPHAFEELPSRGHLGIAKRQEVRGKLHQMGFDDEPPVSYWLWVYYDEHGNWWAEFKLGNDSIRNLNDSQDKHVPCGMLTNARLTLAAENFGAIFDWTGGFIEDQTGWYVRIGEPWYAPLEDKVKTIAKDFPALELPTSTNQKWSERKVQPDNVISTHQTGSPRNAPWPIDLSNYFYFPDNNAGLLPLLDFVGAQIGMKSPVADEWVWGRPYHLIDYQAGETYDFETEYHLDRAKPVRLGEGKVMMPRWGELDTLGRENLRPGDVKDPSSWPFSRIHPKKNGHDAEHWEVARLCVAYLLCPSEVARQEIELVVNTSLTTAYRQLGIVSKDAFWSSRTMWVAEGLLWAGFTLDREDWMDMAHALMEAWANRDYEEWFHDGYKLPADFDYGMTKERQNQYFYSKQNPDWNPVERTWQMAPMGYACMHGRRWHTSKKADWEAWLKRIAGVMKLTWQGPETGHYREFGIRKAEGTVSQPDATIIDNMMFWHGPDLVGTPAWTAPVVGDALILTGDIETYGWVLAYYQALIPKRIGGEYPWQPGGTAYHRGSPHVFKYMNNMEALGTQK